MPILIPIQGDVETPFHTRLFVADLSLDTYNGRSNHANYSLNLRGASRLTSLSSLSVKTSIVDEAIGSVDINNALTSSSIEGTCELVGGDDFLILADVLAQNLAITPDPADPTHPYDPDNPDDPNNPPVSAGGSIGNTVANIAYSVHPELLVDGETLRTTVGTELKMKSFQYQRPTGKLGALLNVEFSGDDPAQIPNNASITFQMMFNGTPHVLIDSSKLQERDYTIAYEANAAGGKPANRLTISTLDVMADKFSLAPRRPVTMYDPYRVKYDQVYNRSDQQMRDENFGPIQPIIEPVAGLTMLTVLKRAYTGVGGFGFMTAGISFPSNMLPLRNSGTNDYTGCGFSNIVTNIEDFPVRRADFTIEGGWHDGAQPSVAMYDPVYTTHGNVLYILYLDKPLPAGISAYTVPVWKHKSLTEKLNFRPDANAIVLTYQYNANDPTEDMGSRKQARMVFHDDTVQDSGFLPNTPGYYHIQVRRWDIETFMSDQPDVILGTFPKSTETTTSAAVCWHVQSSIEQTYFHTQDTARETIDYTYEGDLKVGHHRVTEAAIYDPHDFFSTSLLTVEEEVCRQSWTEDPNNPGTKLLDRVVTEITGRCVYDNDNPETYMDVNGGEHKIFRYFPIVLAQRSGIMSPSLQITGMVPVKTITQKLQNMKGGQLDMEVVEIDHLNNTIHRSYTQPVTGTTNNNQFETKSRQVLLVDEESVAEIGFRIPVGLNAYELPRQRALDLGHNNLMRLKHPLMTMPIEFSGIDFSVVQGSVIKGQRRDGTLTSNYFVTGFEYNGTNLGKEGHRVSQSCEAIEMLPLT